MKNSFFFIIILFLSGCGVKPPPPAPGIDNIPLPSSWTKQPTITLQNGSYSEEAAPGSASKITINASDYFAKGTIHGQKVLATILVTSPGGSGTFYDLFLFTEENNKLQYAAQTPLGDRIRINRVGVTDNMVKVSLSIRKTGTAMADEPDIPVIKSFNFINQQLSEPSQPEATPTVLTVPPETFADKTFYWQSSLYGNDTQKSPENPNQYSITFNKNWTITIHSDCNTTGGFFGLSGSRLTIRPDLPVDACSRHSLSPAFLRDLNDAVIFFFQDNNLYIDLIYDTGTLILTNQL